MIISSFKIHTLLFNITVTVYILSHKSQRICMWILSVDFTVCRYEVQVAWNLFIDLYNASMAYYNLKPQVN